MKVPGNVWAFFFNLIFTFCECASQFILMHTKMLFNSHSSCVNLSPHLSKHKFTLTEVHQHRDQRNTGETFLFLSSSPKQRRMPNLAFTFTCEDCRRSAAAHSACACIPKTTAKLKLQKILSSKNNFLFPIRKNIPRLNKIEPEKTVSCCISLPEELI